MSEPDEPAFHELRGEYVEKRGQVLNLSEYLDYFEPLGSALSRQPDGAGGPFVHQFRSGGAGGQIVSSIGWVVSSAAVRFGGWRLWGMWSHRPIPAIALVMLWPRLRKPDQLGRMIEDANGDARRMLDPRRWPDLLDRADVRPLRDASLRRELAAQLTKAYAARKDGTIEVEVAPEMLDILPWLYLLGPVDPAAAQLQPGRFHGSGYQYILGAHRVGDPEIDPDMETIVDQTADDAAKGWEAARAYRARRTAPPARRAPSRPQRPRPIEREPMKSVRPAPPPRPWDVVRPWLVPAWRIVVLLLLAWLIYDVRRLRPAAPAPTVSVAPAPDTSAPAAPALRPPTRMQRLHAALAARPPAGIRIDPRALDAINGESAAARTAAAHLAVEIALRQNACVDRSSPADAKLSAAESRAARTCPATQRFYRNDELDVERAVGWLEGVVEAPPPPS